MPASGKRSTNFASKASALHVGDTVKLDVEAVVRDVRIDQSTIGSPEVHVIVEVAGTTPRSSSTLSFVWPGHRMVAVTKWAPTVLHGAVVEPAPDEEFKGL